MANGFEALRRRGINIQANPDAEPTEAELVQAGLTSPELPPVGMEHLAQNDMTRMRDQIMGRGPVTMDQVEALLGGAPSVPTMADPELEALLGGAAPPSVQNQAPVNLPAVTGDFPMEVPPPPAENDGEPNLEDISGGMFSEEDILRGNTAKKMKEAAKKIREVQEAWKELGETVGPSEKSMDQLLLEAQPVDINNPTPNAIDMRDIPSLRPTPARIP